MDLKPLNVKAGEGVKLKTGMKAEIQAVRWSSMIESESATVVLLVETEDSHEPLRVHVMDAEIVINKDTGTRSLYIPGAIPDEEAVSFIQGRLSEISQELQDAIKRDSTKSHSAIVDTRARAKVRTKKKRDAQSTETELAIQAIMTEHECTKKVAKEILAKEKSG